MNYNSNSQDSLARLRENLWWNKAMAALLMLAEIHPLMVNEFPGVLQCCNSFRLALDSATGSLVLW